MSDTTETADSRLREKAPAIDAVIQRLAELDPDTPVAADFADLFLARAPEDLPRQRSVDDLVAMTEGAFRFLRMARRDHVDVQVCNPGDDEEAGWVAPVTVIRTNVSERPFIVDTIREFIHAQDLAVERMVYTILDVARDGAGEVTSVRRPADGGSKESLVHCEVGLILDQDRRRWIREELTRRLQDVVRATEDFAPMIDSVNAVVVELAERASQLEERSEEIREVQDFLRWLRDGAMVFLGYRAYDLMSEDGVDRSVVVEPGSGLGILRNEALSRFAGPVALSQLDRGVRDLAEHGPLLIISKTNAESTVHRRARMDYVGVKKLDAAGRVIGEHRFMGLFTSKAYSEPAENIPILRRMLASILEESGVQEGSHDYKEIITIFNSMPKEELFLTSAEQVGADIRTVLTAYNTSDVRVSLREDPLKRGLAVMIILPKDRFSGAIRKTIEAELVGVFGGGVLNYHLALGSGDQARLHFHMSAPVERLSVVEPAQIEQIVAQLIRTWSDRVREGLEVSNTPDEARELAERYGTSLSREYQAATDPAVAVWDIVEIEAMKAEDRTVSIALANRHEDVHVAGVEGATELKVFLRGERLILSDFMPILEDAGLRVVAVKPFALGANGDTEATIYVFAVQGPDGARLDVRSCGDLLSETVLAVRAGDALSDRLNALVVSAGLHWREVDVLRGYVGYAFQVGAVPSRMALPSALVQYPGLARELFDLFAVRFDPERDLSPTERREAAADISAAFHGSLAGVAALSDDRALRRLEELIFASVRTNYFRHGGRTPSFRSGGVPYISYKFDCAKMDFAARSRLLYEVWVHSARMEGVHLRGARVARGGIRWSDRPDDFRAEILGLVNTQVVKNAVIVPSGSKGGFITRLGSSDPDEVRAEGQRQYETLIRGLLDLTDNLVDGGPVAPERTVGHDDPDPYLVVAADKGTATFSDVANAVAAEYDFWLGDAFASGGSHGYDHKAVGITARGAWECVKRHFREKGKDIQTEPFTVVGIGDMSGDVFGNGMLLSEQIRLVAAFDHRHVFIDPNPDPSSSFAERSRLFELGRSSWEDYDESLLSPGGMIVPRAAKEVVLTDEARRALGIKGEGGSEEDVATLDGESLIRRVLMAPAELLWNGGIGTYVKADAESDTDAADPSNDPVRVNVSDLRCEVVGEGGNLGFTQRARVDFALRGGRINTDALDNSAGVDMSDHEVNLKILLGGVVARGEMSEARRNELLEELTEPVAALVLADNRSQSRAVSLDERRAREATDDFRDLMFSLEKAGQLDRTAEGLPSFDVLEERAARGQTLTRPELCVLLAYAKLSLKAALLGSRLPDDPVTESYLLGYFPPRSIVAAGQADLSTHRLRREIIASQLANDLIDVMGATFVSRLARDTGWPAESVARAWLVASRLADHRALLAQMAEQEMNTRVAYRWLLGLGRVLERTTRWVLQNIDDEVSPSDIVDRSLGGLADLRDAFSEVVAGEERTLFDARVREVRDVGADDLFSERLITLRFLDQLLEIVEISRETGSDVVPTAKAYYRVSELFDLPWLRRSMFATAGDDHWENRAARVLSDDLSRAHRKLVTHAMRVASESGEDWLANGRLRDIERFRGILAELKGEATVGLAAVSVAARELSALADRVS